MITISTKKKIALAKILRHVIKVARGMIGKGDQVIVRRGDIIWDLNLGEGIDFAIYILGGFELQTLRLYKKIINQGDTVVDVGANIGAHTLPFAQLVGPRGTVAAFEPTKFAFSKLKRNLSLNPSLAQSIRPFQVLLQANEKTPVPKKIYSSWPLDNPVQAHAVHGGVLKETSGAQTSTIDQMILHIGLNRLDFIKLDVDGHEPEVLNGALSSIQKFKPFILLEWAPYLYKDKKGILIKNLQYLKRIGYCAYPLGCNKPYPIEDVIKTNDLTAEKKASWNILLKPRYKTLADKKRL